MLLGEKVNIRPLRRDDLDWFTEWNNNPEYKGPYEPLETNTLEEITEWFDSEKNTESWVITDKKGTPLGQIITGPQGDYYWLGYILHPDHRGHGYTTEAVKLLVDHLFTTKNIVRVQAECNPENRASVRVLEKAGFTYEGLKRKAVYIQGVYMDGALYSVLREEWNLNK
jgi:RimJ/RimL family protein N-acetyltransferase